MSKANEIVAIAIAEIGYKEKTSNASLDDKTANAGSANWTKYARDLASAGYYNGNKNGFAWCDVFTDWCFFKAYGATDGQRIQCQTGDLGAGCTYSMQYYKNQGRLDMNPKVGDQIFFRYSGNSGADHTGIVVEVTDTQVITVEGNSGNQVKKNSYSRSYGCIIGYGHPMYDDIDYAQVTTTTTPTTTASTAKSTKNATTVSVTLTQLSKGSLGAEVKTIQRIMRVYGIDNSLDIDGDFGVLTEAAVKRLQNKLFPNDSTEWDGVVGKNTWSAMLTELK